MDNKDLVLEAVKHFGGVWPDGATHILQHVNDLGFQASNKSGCLMRYLHSAGVFNQDFWQTACTREQFEARVEALFDGAPEDATHFGFETGYLIEAWYKKGFFWNDAEGGGWQSTLSNRQDLIPRQKQKPTAEKWMPEAGQECEYKTQHQWIKVTIDHIGKKFIVFQDEHGQEFSRRIAKAEFRPLKTEAEKERDEGIKALTKILSKGVGDCEPDEYLATTVWDAGWRPSND